MDINEQLDPKILKILGVESPADIPTYEDYLGLLKKVLIESSVGSKKNNLSNDDIALLVQEIKRVKGIKTGRDAKPKTSQTNSTQKLLGKSPISSIVKRKSGSIVPYFKSTDVEDDEKKSSSFSDISNSLNNIISILKDQLRFDSKIADEDKKNKEKGKRKRKENMLESAFKGTMGFLKKVGSKLFSPFQNLFNKIINFLTWVFLGKVFIALFKWFSDPKNEDKVKFIFGFIEKFWPALLVVMSPIRGLVGSLIKMLLGFTARMATKVIPALVAAARAHPKAAIAIAVGTAATAGIGALLNSNKEDSKTQSEPKAQTFNFGGLVRNLRNYTLGGAIPSSYFGDGYGGIDENTGESITGAGRDTQLIAARPGEVVLTPEDQTHIHKMTGFNIPEYVSGRTPGKVSMNNIKFKGFGKGFFNGGMISAFNKGGMVGGNKSFNLINQKSKTIFDRLVNGGLTPTAAAGIVANIGVETGYTYDPNTLQSNGGPGRGLVQWEKGGRFDTDRINLRSFAKNAGKPWNDLNTQVDFILHEMKVHPEYKIVKQKMNAAKDIESTTKIFLTDYEKAGTPHTERRLKVAQQIVDAGYLNKHSKAKSKSEVKEKAAESPWYKKMGDWFVKNMMPGSPAYAKPQKKQYGGNIGLVDKKDGLHNAHSSTDSVAALLDPGEFVITEEAKESYGEHNLARINALDENSESARRGIKPFSFKPNFVDIGISSPSEIYSDSTPIIDTSLLDKMQGGGGSPMSLGRGNGTEIPFPSPLCFVASAQRSMIFDVMGITA